MIAEPWSFTTARVQDKTITNSAAAPITERWKDAADELV
jgi:hypothetical protein